MNFLGKLFRQKYKFERKTAISGCKVIYGHEANLEAQHWQVPIGYKQHNPITLIEKVLLPGPVDVVIDFAIHCRKHAHTLKRSVESSFMMMPQLFHLKLPCGCLAEFSMCNGNLSQIFLKADDNFNLVVEDIREGVLVERNIRFSECPNCKNSVKRGRGEHFAIYQCVKCHTRFCYNCAAGEGCPRCGRHTDRFGVGEVRDEV
jgi:hypothetical protein